MNSVISCKTLLSTHLDDFGYRYLSVREGERWGETFKDCIFYRLYFWAQITKRCSLNRDGRITLYIIRIPDFDLKRGWGGKAKLGGGGGLSLAWSRLNLK